jgi:hypothetical protein
MFKTRTFLNDSDGFSNRDYILLAISPYFLFWAIAVGMSLMGYEVPESFYRLMDSVSGVVMTTIGGVYGVQAIHSGASAIAEYRYGQQTATNTVDDSSNTTEERPRF